MVFHGISKKLGVVELGTKFSDGRYSADSGGNHCHGDCYLLYVERCRGLLLQIDTTFDFS